MPGIGIGIGVPFGGFDPAGQAAAAFRQRVIADGGTFEADSCLVSEITRLSQLGLYDDFALLVTPNGYKAGTLYSIIPSSGAADMAVARSGVTGTRVDEAGAYETMAANVPRLDWYDRSCPVMSCDVTRTNLFLNSETLVTQDVTVTAQAYTVSFMGTGTVTFSGAHTGSLVGTGAQDIVEVTFTPSAGTVTCTVSGSATNANFEAGTYRSNWIPTGGATASRPVDTCLKTGIGAVLPQMDFTLYYDVYYPHNSGDDSLSINRSVSNSVALIRDGIGRFTSRIYHSATLTSLGLSGVLSGRSRHAIAVSSGDLAYYANGAQIGTSSDAISFGAALDSLYIMPSSAFYSSLNSEYFHAAGVLSRRLSNTELASLTAI